MSPPLEKAAPMDTPAPVRSLLKLYNRAGAPSIVDLGFDAQPESGTEEDLRDQTAKDLIGFPGERAPHISFGFEGERWRIRNIVWVLSQSTTGHELLDQTYRAGYRLGFDPMTCTSEYLKSAINTADRVILLDSRATNEQLVVDLALQLGFAGASVDGAYFDQSFSPPSALIAQRLAAAYAHSAQLQICFELRENPSLPSNLNKDVYWRIVTKLQHRLAGAFAQAAVNDFALTQGNAAAVAIREFYAHVRLRHEYDVEVINYFRSLPLAVVKDTKAMTSGFDATTQSLKLKLPGAAYAQNHDPRLNLNDTATVAVLPEIAQAVTALQAARRNAGVKDRDSWQVKERQD